MKKHIMLLCTTLLSMQSAYAMEMNDALASAYTTNESLKQAQQQFLQQAENFPQALAKFLPDISMGITSQKVKNTTVGQYAGSPNSPTTNTGPDVSRSLTVTQNVFNGGQDIHGMKMAQSAFLQYKATLYNAEQDMLTNAVKAYLGLCVTKEQYDIAVDAVTFNARSLNTVEEQLKVGEATITDVATAQAQLYGAEANKSGAFASLLAAKAAFRTVIGVEADDDVVFPKDPDNMPETQESFAAVVVKSNFDLMTAKSQAAQSKDGVKQAQGALLPTATLSLSQTNNYFNPEQSPASGSGNRQNDRALQAQMSLKIPIFSSGGVAYSNIRQNKAKSRLAIYNLDYTKKTVDQNVISTWEQFKSLKDQIKSTEEAVKAQTLAVEGMQSGYAVGTQTLLDVLTQQNTLNQSRSQAVKAKNDYFQAAFAMKALMGQLTAKQMKLKVKYFDPEYEFRNVKHKIVGF